MRKIGCLAILVVIGLLVVELWFFLKVCEWSHREYLGCILAVLVLTIVGVRLARYHLQAIAPALMQGRAGRHVIGMLGAVLLIIPGFLTGAFGLLLSLPPVQSLFAKVGNVLVAGIARKAMGGMFGGRSPFGGGFPAGFPGGLPSGGMDLRPDDRARFPKPPGAGKTYDAKPEKE